MARLATRSGRGIAGDLLERVRQPERVARELDARRVGQVLAVTRDGDLDEHGGDRREDRQHDGDDEEDRARAAALVAVAPAEAEERRAQEEVAR